MYVTITQTVITNKKMINQTDIDYIVSVLNTAIKRKDWDLVLEIQEYVTEFQDTPIYEEE